MEESVLNEEMLLRLHNRVCMGREVVAGERGVKAKITLSIEIGESLAKGTVEETYTLDIKIGDAVRHEACAGQLTLPEFALAGLKPPPSPDWEQTN